MKTIEEPFVWTMHDGTEIAPAAMDTPHVFHSLRMVWNHVVPPALRLEPFRYWAGVSTWPADELRGAFDAFLAELDRRKDVTLEQQSEVTHMRRHASAFEAVLETLDREQLMEEAVWGPDRDGGGD